uniref:Anthranilate phosphoribosyltransferase n=1 Tax=Schlesneria paludicola TaxID=360056 RepID=A0A7C2K042_9PLAN
MLDELTAVVTAALEQREIGEAEMHRAVAAMMDGRCSEMEIASVLTALRCRGESVDQLVGAARAMRERATPIATKRRGLLDTCGTGGDGLHTFNVSTATALVAAAAGVPVAKHGNRSASSRSGSADVLEALGVSLALTPQQVGECIDDVGIGFCFAQSVHTAMKHVAPVRKQLGFRTIFNLLGPLTNPAGAEFQLVGACRITLAELLAEALSRLGVKHALVVCGNDELDEVSLWGETTVIQVRGEAVLRHTWTATTLELPECSVSDVRVGSPEESAAVVRGVLEGAVGPARNLVLANAAAAFVAAERVETPRQGVELAAGAIDTGEAARLLERFAARTRDVVPEKR